MPGPLVRQDTIKLDDSEDKGPAIQVLNRVPTPPPLIQVLKVFFWLDFNCVLSFDPVIN